MSLLLLFKDYWHQTRGDTGPDISGWTPPPALIPEKPKKKTVKKRRLIKVTKEAKVPFDRFKPEQWYGILWLVEVRVLGIIDMKSAIYDLLNKYAARLREKIAKEASSIHQLKMHEMERKKREGCVRLFNVGK